VGAEFEVAFLLPGVVGLGARLEAAAEVLDDVSELLGGWEAWKQKNAITMTGILVGGTWLH
jgi:hypothetical protein